MQITKFRDFDQLVEERRWLRKSFLAPVRSWQPRPEWIAFVEQVQQVLASPQLRNFLRVLEQHNRDRDKRANPFLLGPYLFRIIQSIEARQEYLQRMPALNRSPTELRTHFRDASAKAKGLARLVRRGPRPFIALASRDDAREAFSLFTGCQTIQSPNELEAYVPLDRLLDEAAESFDLLAEKISRPRARGSVKSEAAGLLATTFRKKLKRPYHSEVATIVQVLTGIPTDEDYVKKIEKRWAGAVKGQKS